MAGQRSHWTTVLLAGTVEHTSLGSEIAVMTTQLTPEQEKELRDWSHKAFAEARAETEREAQFLNELSRKRAQEKFAWTKELPAQRKLKRELIRDMSITLAMILFFLGMIVYTLL